jgi:Carboxypeptidase regulatory-like domain/TonB dependent receptor
VKRIGLPLAFLLTGLFLALPGVAQLDRGTITGTITDATGAVIPGAKITIKNQATNTAWETVSTGSGDYTAPNLPSGVYSMTIASPGLKTLVRSNVVVTVSETARVDASLQIGSATDTITVAADAEKLQTDNGVTGVALQNRQVNELPLTFGGGGRDAENFAIQLAPGVAGSSGTTEINGTPAFSKEVLLDGATITGYRSGDLSEASPSPEALQEFKVETSGMSAEYGRTSGGLFNFVMKSGTNQVHGSLLFEFRNQDLDANTFLGNFDGQARPIDRQLDGGGSFGGPVRIPKIYNGKDKSFFYFAMERFYSASSASGTANEFVPPPSWYSGNMSDLLTSTLEGKDALGNQVYRGAIYDPNTSQTVNGTLVRTMFPDNTIPLSRFSVVSQQVLALMQKDYPATVPGPNGDYLIAQNAYGAYNTWQRNTQISAKGDHNVSNKDHLSGSYLRTTQPHYEANASATHVWDNLLYGGPFSSAIIKPVDTSYVRLASDHTFTPTLLNHAGIYFNRVTNSIDNLHYSQPNPLTIPGTLDKSVPVIAWSGGDGRYSLTPLGQDKASDTDGSVTYGVQDTLSWVKGRHTVKAGAEYRVYKLNHIADPDPGTFTFSSNQTGLPGFTSSVGNPFASFLLGDVNNASTSVTTPTLATYPSVGLFLQDDFRVTSKLTINMGLRWDYNPTATEEHNRLFSFSPTTIDPQTGLPGALIFAGNCSGCNGQTGFESQHYLNFAPRFGFAYQVMPKTVIRGAYGIFFSDRAPNDYYGDPNGAVSVNGWGWGASNVVNYGNNLAPTFNWDNGYPGVNIYSTQNPSQADSKSGAIYWYPNGGRLGYTQSWNFNIQRELPFSMVLDVGYLGTKGTALENNGFGIQNQLPPAALALGSALNGTVTSQAGLSAAAVALGARYPFGNTGQSVPVWQTLTPFPQLLNGSTVGGWDVPLGFSTYHALQVQLNKRYTNGLSWLANYTFSKSLSNVTNLYEGSGSTPMIATNLGLEKSISSYDQPQVVKIGMSYELPVGKGKQFGSSLKPVVDNILGGWKLQYIGNYNSGTPLSFPANSPDSSTNLSTNRAQLSNPAGVGLGVPFNSSAFNAALIGVANPSNMYLNTQYIKQPAPYTFGNAAPEIAQIRGFAARTENIALLKNWLIRERMRFQLRCEALNAFNRHTFGGISTNPTSATFGDVTSVSGNRNIQLGARIEF